MVLLVIIGLAQKPILNINPSVKNKKHMPKRKPILSPNHPIIKGAMAPPIIPVTIIPENEPWCSLTEFKAKEKIMGYRTEAKNPTMGKAIKAMEEVPNNAIAKLIIARPVNVISTMRLSIIFKRSKPNIPPAVIKPQK